jgi:hypothetical protein
MLVVGTATAALTCRPLCCRSPTAGALHYNLPTTGRPTVQPAALPAGQLPGQEDPPSYTDVANNGGKYLKF